MSERQKPVKEFTLNFVSTAIWEFPQNGKPARFSFTTTKSYKDTDSGEWKRTNFLSPQDAIYVELTQRKAVEWIAEAQHRRAKEKSEAPESAEVASAG